MNELNRPLTLQEAADQIGTSRSRLWRAMSEGYLGVEKRRVGGRSVWTVLESDLTKWAQEFLSTLDLPLEEVPTNGPEQIFERSRTTANVHEQNSEHPRTSASVHEQSRTNTNEQSSNSPSHPPVELYLALVDRLQRAERRTVELELNLRQSQRLLCENAESITEREARAKQAEAVAEQHRQREQELAEENVRVAAELEATRRQLAEAQKPKGLFSWLSLRKKRAAVSVEKAV